MLLSVVIAIPIVIEVNYYNIYGINRYLPEMPIYTLILRRVSILLRLTALAGVFISCVFYLTNRIFYLNCLAAVTTLVALSLVLNYEMSNQGRIDSWEANETTYGASPVWWYIINMLTPIGATVALYMLNDQTGLILQDNDQLAFVEEDHHGVGLDRKLYRIHNMKTTTTDSDFVVPGSEIE
jgi:hypothetical protein